MNLFPIQAGTAILFDACLGQSLIGLLALCGAAVTVVAATRWYVGILRSKGERQRVIIEHFKGSHNELQQKFQEELDRLSDRHLQSQSEFQSYVAVMSDIQNMILRDVIVTMRNFEKYKLDEQVTGHGVQAIVGTLQPVVDARDCRHCRMAVEDV